MINRYGLAALLLLAAVRATAAPPLEVYGQLPGCQFAAIAPSGERYAVVGNVDGVLDLIVLTADATPLLVTAIGNHKVASIAFADDDHVILWLRSTVKLGADFVQDQTEMTGAIIVDVKRRSMLPVLAQSRIFGGVQDFFGTVRKDGHSFGYFSAVTLARGIDIATVAWDGNRPDLYQVDIASGASRIVARHGEGIARRDWLVDGDGQVAATLEKNEVSGRWSVRGATGAEIARGGAPVTVALAGLSSAGIVTFRDDGGGDSCCFIAGAAAPEPLYAGTGADQLVLDPRDRSVIGYVTEADHPQTHFLDPRREKAMRGIRKAFTGLDVAFVGASDSFDQVMVQTTGSGDAGSWWFVDIKTGAAKPVGFAYAAIPLADIAPVRMVSWTAADGTKLSGVLTSPPGRAERSLPVIVLPHGGPAARDYPVFDWWAQALAVQGYAVFQPNFRGSTGYGRALLKAGEGEWGGKMLGDIADGVKALAGQGIVDPKRACIVGASYGGYAALAGVTLQHGLYRCAVAVAPVSDLTSFISLQKKENEEQLAIAREWKTKLGTAPLATLSPAAHAAEADAPVLLIHGTGDTVVPFAQSEMMRSRLAKAGKPVELVTLPGEDHWLSKSATRLAMLKATVDFVRKHNPPD